MEQIRRCLSGRISADMDCESVVRLTTQQTHLPPALATPQKRPYGNLSHALAQARPKDQPPLQWIPSHPERPRPATVTHPARQALPKAQWTKRAVLNSVADTLTHPTEANIRKLQAEQACPDLIIPCTLDEVLDGAMGPDSIYWQHQGLPAATYVGITAPARAAAYLSQRDLVSSYPAGYWSNSEIGLLEPILRRTGSARAPSKRASLLNLVFDQCPHGRKKGQFAGSAAPDPC